jgi:hypothetical protein
MDYVLDDLVRHTRQHKALAVDSSGGRMVTLWVAPLVSGSSSWR